MATITGKCRALDMAVFNVKNFGALGNGIGVDPTTADTTPIQAAIDAAIAAGGTVYFPPGTYKITSMLNLTSSGGTAALSIVGDRDIAGSNPRITANFAGFMLSQPHVGKQILHYMAGLSFSNTHPQGCCLLLENCNSVIVEQCSFSAPLIGAHSYQDCYCVTYRSCFFNGPAGNYGVGLLLGQASADNCSLTGWGAAAVRMGNVGGSVTKSRLEVNQISFHTGLGSAGLIVSATWSAGTVTVQTADTLSSSSFPQAVNLFGFNPPAYNTPGTTVTATYVDANHFTYPLAANPGASPATTAGAWSAVTALTGFTYSGNSHERGDIHVLLANCGGGLVAGNQISGNRIGPGHPISSASWSAGTITVNVASSNTLDSYGFTSGTRTVQLDSFTGGTWNSMGAVTATYVSATQFTISHADPGAYSIAGNWSLYPQYGIKCVSASSCLISGNSPGGAYEQYAIDASGGVGSEFVANRPGGLVAITNSWNLPAGPLGLDAGAPATVISFTNQNLDGSQLFSNITGATYTIGGGIPGNGEWPTITCNRATSQTITVAQDGTAALTYPIGWVFKITQIGAGAVSFVAGSGVTLNSKSTSKAIAAQYGEATLRKVAANTWVLSGDLAA